jgi:hypothetical protein
MNLTHDVHLANLIFHFAFLSISIFACLELQFQLSRHDTKTMQAVFYQNIIADLSSAAFDIFKRNST